MKKTANVKPIETVYNGYRFRSRLEARWAIYFDALGIKYEYEPEGYELGNNERYLPDFWLPQVNMWAEVKGPKFNKKEIRKAAKLFLGTTYPILLLSGSPSAKFYPAIEGSPQSNKRFSITLYSVNDYKNYFLEENRFYCSPGHKDPRTEGSLTQSTLNAIKMANQARFEHGETPEVHHAI
jgi:hypothetical protein